MKILFGEYVRRSLLIVLSAGVLVLMLPSAFAANTSSAEREVDDAVRNLVDAYAKNDYERYFGLMTNDISIWAGGRKERVTKKEYYDLWKAQIEKGGGISKGAVEDLRIQVSPGGDTAVATFFMPVTSRVSAGSAQPPRDINYNIAHVWWRNGGRWELVHYYWSSWTAAAPNNAPSSNR